MELKVLLTLTNVNIISYKGVDLPNRTILVDLYQITLFDFIVYYNKPEARQRVKKYDFRHLCTDLISAVKFLHSNFVIHRDINPRNILVESITYPCKLVLADFGKSYYPLFSSFLSKHVDLNRYSAPELQKRESREYSYNNKIDIWSSGCVIYEIETGFPLFGDKLQTLEGYRFAKNTNLLQVQDTDIRNLIKRMVIDEPEERATAKQCLREIVKMIV